MATLLELCYRGVITAIDPLEPDELSWRTLYGTNDFITWLDEELPTLSNNPLYSNLSAIEQVSAMFAEYVSGENFSTDRRFKKLSRTPDNYVWELKTDDVRIFGWVPKRDVFICCYGDGKQTIVNYDSYGRYAAQTDYVRRQMDLDEPKYLETERYTDVLSTKN